MAACGLDLRTHGNVFFMSHVSDPRRFYRISRAVMVSSLGSETVGRVAAEAICDGIPVLAGDCEALPETLGASGIVLSLLDRLTPTSEILSTLAEVMPWVEAVIRLWDDAGFYEDLRQRASSESERWHPSTVESQFVSFFRRLTEHCSTV